MEPRCCWSAAYIATVPSSTSMTSWAMSLSALIAWNAWCPLGGPVDFQQRERAGFLGVSYTPQRCRNCIGSSTDEQAGVWGMTSWNDFWRFTLLWQFRSWPLRCSPGLIRGWYPAPTKHTTAEFSQHCSSEASKMGWPGQSQ